MKKDLYELYKEWRKAGEDAIEGTDINFTCDCGEASAREDFAYYSNIEEITYEEMLKLERKYEKEK